MEPQPLLSVILPVRDPDRAMFARCLASFDALRAAPQIEVIVVRTGSLAEDALPAASRLGARIVIECAEPGIYPAFNAGTARASGRFLVFFGHDDIALPDMDIALSRLATDRGLRTLIACGMFVQGLGLRWPTCLRQGIVFRNWGHQAIFYSADLLRERLYDPRFPLRADHRLNIALLADRSVRCVRLPLVVSFFSRGGYSTGTIEDREFDAGQAAIAAESFGPLWGVAVRVLLPAVRFIRSCIRQLARLAGKSM